jgi:hypothetical protein
MYFLVRLQVRTNNDPVEAVFPTNFGKDKKRNLTSWLAMHIKSGNRWTEVGSKDSLSRRVRGPWENIEDHHEEIDVVVKIPALNMYPCLEQSLSD